MEAMTSVFVKIYKGHFKTFEIVYWQEQMYDANNCTLKTL